jgi:hypothetical protein
MLRFDAPCFDAFPRRRARSSTTALLDLADVGNLAAQVEVDQLQAVAHAARLELVDRTAALP